VTRPEPNAFHAHLSPWADPRLGARLQAAQRHGPQPPRAGSFPRPSPGAPASFHRGQATPRETQPQSLHPTASGTCYENYTGTGGRFLCAPRTGENQALRHTNPLPDPRWQQGTLLWVRKQAYVSIYSSYNATSLIKATTSPSVATPVRPQFHGRHHSISTESDRCSWGRNIRLSCAGEILTQS